MFVSGSQIHDKQHSCVQFEEKNNNIQEEDMLEKIAYPIVFFVFGE